MNYFNRLMSALDILAFCSNRSIDNMSRAEIETLTNRLESAAARYKLHLNLKQGATECQTQE